MAFQFSCPQGHVLEGDESQAGQTCQCPLCATLFIIPYPEAAAEPQADYDAHGGEPASFDADADADGGERLLHIPCPNGHSLETPAEMLGQYVLCPHCGAQFELREKDSIEYKRRREDEQRRKEARRAKLWLNWAIIVAVLVGLSLVTMIVVLVNR